MKKNNEIIAKKSTFFGKKVKINLKKIFVSFSKSAIMFSVGKYENGFKELISIVEGFKSSTKVSDLAYQLVISSLINAASHLIQENRDCFISHIEDVENLENDPKYSKFFDTLNEFIEKKEFIFDFEMIKNPRTIPILEEFKHYFYQYLELFGIPKKDAEFISNRLPSYFIFELNDEWRTNFSKYEPLIEHLDAPTREAAKKERQWEAYNTYLEREIEKPVFGESFSLQNIYIPLRAFYKHIIKNKDKSEEVEKVAVKLEESLDTWLASNKSEDTIKVIQGGPGSGKSSFVKWWAGKLARERKLPVLFFPLHHFNIHTNIKTAIGEYFKDSSNIPLEFNPLEDNQVTEKMLLIFDGLDELVMQGKSSKEAASAFIQELKNYCNLKNQGKQRIQVLITGRPIAVQDTETKLRDGDQQILFLLPYYLNKEQLKEYKDTDKILKKDQRNEWWNNFFVFKELSNHNLPEELKNARMDKITSEPLLNYLVALSWKDAPEKFNIDTNINDVYYQLMLGVYLREYEDRRRSRATGDLTADDFIQILEEIAICAWQGGDARVTSERKIEKHINNRGLDSLLEEYKNSAQGGGVSRLLTAFYFRKFGKEDTETKDDTFEFTHKSFGEYLAARAIVELIATTHEEREEYKKKATSRRNRQKGWSIQRVLEEWLRMTGKNKLDNDITNFIFNEIQLRKKAGESIVAWQQNLCEVISELVETGMPMHSQEQRLNHLEERRLARNAEEALVVVLANCAKVTEKLSKIDWKSSNSAAIWFSRLSSSLQNNVFAFSNLNYLDLKKINLETISIIDVNFNYTNLEGVNMFSTVFIFGSFFKTNLKRVTLKRATIIHSSFTAANLERANIQLADLSYSGLRRANLKRVNLQGTDLTDTDLTDTNLTNANLTNANLTNANLSGADIENAIVNLEQLLQTKSLYKTKNIPKEILDQIKKLKPALLEKRE